MGRGIIVQKYIEDPHLIDVERLARCLIHLRAHDTVLSDAVAVGGSRSDTGGGNERALALDVNMHTDMRTRNHVTNTTRGSGWMWYGRWRVGRRGCM